MTPGPKSKSKPNPRRFQRYLTIDVTTGDGRVTRKPPYSKLGEEVTFRLNVTVPRAWDEILAEIDLALPEPGDVEVRVEEAG